MVIVLASFDPGFPSGKSIGMAKERPRQRQPNKANAARLWPLLAVNFFMADMQSGIALF
jgi:hypothetical protein